MAQKKQQEKKYNTHGMSKAEIKGYQKILRDVNLYEGNIDGIWKEKTHVADSTFKVLSEKGYSKSQMFRHSIDAPHMSDEEWGDYIGGKRGFQKPKIEDAVIDSMKKEY